MYLAVSGETFIPHIIDEEQESGFTSEGTEFSPGELHVISMRQPF
ncbi:hypothetical protein ASZ90_016498 [hydrocarbon metagenome]|uniref:Uncharacterized protein n=1 Tax=hydrocarbon metagenome TaxID=938273 RepID=A0A0W8ER89_9ZZZZ